MFEAENNVLTFTSPEKDLRFSLLQNDDFKKKNGDFLTPNSSKNSIIFFSYFTPITNFTPLLLNNTYSAKRCLDKSPGVHKKQRRRQEIKGKKIFYLLWILDLNHSIRFLQNIHIHRPKKKEKNPIN